MLKNRGNIKGPKFFWAEFWDRNRGPRKCGKQKEISPKQISVHPFGPLWGGPKFVPHISVQKKNRSQNAVQKFRSQISGFSQREFGDISGPVSAQQFRALVRGLCPSSGPHNRGHNPEIMLNPNALYLTMAYLILLDPTLPSSFKFTGCPTTLAIPPTACYISPAVFLKTMYIIKKIKNTIQVRAHFGHERNARRWFELTSRPTVPHIKERQKKERP